MRLRTTQHSTLKTQHYALLHRPKPIQSYLLYLYSLPKTIQHRQSRLFNSQNSTLRLRNNSTLNIQNSTFSLRIPHQLIMHPLRILTTSSIEYGDDIPDYQL